MSILDFTPSPKTLISLIPKQHCGDIPEQLLVSDVQTDSRDVAPGSLFIALDGLRNNGEKYIANAVENGAAAILVEADHVKTILNVEVPVIGIKDIKACAPHIAKQFYGTPSENLSAIGVTGTNGKSTITALVAQIYQQLGKRAAVVGTLGYGVLNEGLIETGMTTPDMVRCQRILAELYADKVDVVAMEVSSHGIHQERITGVTFDAAIISNITHDHLDYHGSFEEYARVKKSFLLSPNTSIAVVNCDDNECATIISELEALGKAYVTYGIDAESAQVKANITKYTDTGVEAELLTPWGTATLNSPFVGKFNVSNILAAISCVCAMGADFVKVIDIIRSLKPVAGRLQKVDAGKAQYQPNVFIDYAHTPDALAQVLTSLRKHVKGKLCVVFGCGGDRDKEKRAVMGKLASELADKVIVTSDNPRKEDPQKIIDDILQGIPSEHPCKAIGERDVAISHAIDECGNDDCILVAGKGHEDYQLIGDKKYPFDDYLIAKAALNKSMGNSSVAGRVK